MGEWRTVRHACLLGFIILSLADCATPAKPAVVTETWDGAAYLALGKLHLSGPTNDRFLSLLNQNHDVYEDESRVLLDLFSKKQRSLAAYFKEAGDYFLARHYFNNLSAVIDINADETARFYDGFLDALMRRGEVLTVQSLIKKYRLPRTLPAKEGSVPIDWNDYNRILAEIAVEIHYKEEDDIPRVLRPYGTGFLVGPSHLLTAYHIVEPALDGRTTAYSITVKIGDEIIENATIASCDPLSDVALLELPAAQPFPYAVSEMFGDSAQLKQGFTVYCLAHHRGLLSTLTRGVVSAVNRKAPEVGSWIQIDANVAPGASGGLLIGEDRKVYGMVVAGILFEDINFAVPSRTLCEILERLQSRRPPRRPWLGLLLEQPRMKNYIPMIIEVFPTSPLAPLAVDDEARLLEINQRRIRSVQEAQEIVGDLEAGNVVQIKIENRAGLKKKYWVTLERRPEFAIYNATREYDKISSLYPHFGFKVDAKNLDTASAVINSKTVKFSFYQVLEVRENSALYDKGVQRGDLIGILDDYYEGRDRCLDILHLPKSATLKMMGNIMNYIYRLKKSKYDENIL